MAGKVYITQEPTRRNRNTGALEATIDFTPASRYGELQEPMLPPGNVMLSPAPMIAKLRHDLRNFDDDDYLIPVGDPTAMAAAPSICAHFNNGRYTILKWDRATRSYIAVKIDITGRATNGL